MRHARMCVVAVLALAASLSPPATTAQPQTDDSRLAQDYLKAKQILDNLEGNKNDFEQARALLFSIIARKRDYAPAYVGLSRLERKAAYLGFTAYQSEGLTRSRKFAEHALKLDPNLFDGQIALAYVAMVEGDFDVARSAVDRAEEISKDAPGAKVARADLAIREGDANGAVRFARQVLAMPNATPNDRASAYGALVQAYQAAGAMDEADAAYQGQLRMRPNSAWSHGNYSQFLLERGKIDESIAQGERAVQIMPYPAGLGTLARAYLAKGDELWDQQRYDAASSYVEKAVRLGGGDADVYYYLGVFYERASKRTGDATLISRAAAAYRKALELKPDQKAARQALDRLRKQHVLR